MAGSYYIALSGMRARLDAFDLIATDIANSSTSGYKTERTSTVEADRTQFADALQSAVDVANGPTRVDLRRGVIIPTGRDFDLAIDGPGLFAVSTPAGERYTRDGHFVRSTEGVLTTASGDPVLSVDDDQIEIPAGPVQIGADGTVRVKGTAAGRIKIVEFDGANPVVKENATRFRAIGDARDATASEVRPGALEQSNVSVTERIVELTSATRGFEAMQRALSTLSNDIDGRAINELGRR